MRLKKVIQIAAALFLSYQTMGCVSEAFSENECIKSWEEIDKLRGSQQVTPNWLPKLEDDEDNSERYFPIRKLTERPYLTGLRDSFANKKPYKFHNDQWNIVEWGPVPNCFFNETQEGQLYLISVPVTKDMDLYKGGRKLPLDLFSSHFGFVSAGDITKVYIFTVKFQKIKAE